jgi:EmrB/QacA subfamily drug resistance transporter
MAFLDGTVVNAALPAIRTQFGSTLAGQQWIVTGYLLTLGALLVVGGSLGDRFGRRALFVGGLVGFSATSALCGAAPNVAFLIAARVLQGVSAAALVPASLAMISAVFHPDDRAAAIGRWTGLAGVSTALGPFLGGWLIDVVSWRWVFLINVPLAAVAVALALRSVPETRSGDHQHPIDIAGASLLSLGLGALVFALIEGPGRWKAGYVGAAVVGASFLVSFVAVERRVAHPMVPLALFRSRDFSGANAVTFVVWGALGTVFFLLTIHLQTTLGYSALEAGAAGMPITVLMLLFAAKAGALATRIGPRLQMSLGPLTIAIGFALLTRVEPGHSYLTTVFPGVAVLAVGLTATVAPLTATVLAAVADSHVGLGSAINNATARVANLLAVAVLPTVAGMGVGREASVAAGFGRAMWLCAALAFAGGVIAAMTISNRSSPDEPRMGQPS